MKKILFGLLIIGCTPRMHRAYRSTITAAGMTAQIVDSRQTYWGLRQGYVETNLLLGRNPSVVRVAGGAGISLGLFATIHEIVETLPDRGPGTELIKDVLVTIPSALEILAVYNNSTIMGSSTWRQW